MAGLPVPADQAASVWETLEAPGGDLGLKPVGLGALHSLRLEKGYRDYGVDRVVRLPHVPHNTDHASLPTQVGVFGAKFTHAHRYIGTFRQPGTGSLFRRRKPGCLRR